MIFTIQPHVLLSHQFSSFSFRIYLPLRKPPFSIHTITPMPFMKSIRMALFNITIVYSLHILNKCVLHHLN